MKKILLAITIVLAASTFSFAQSNEAVLESGINTKFISWSSEWWVDSYNNNSVNIIDIDSDNSSTWYVTGTYWVTRLGSRIQQNFTATVNVYSDGDWKISKLCYDDPSSGDKACKNY